MTSNGCILSAVAPKTKDQRKNEGVKGNIGNTAEQIMRGNASSVKARAERDRDEKRDEIERGKGEKPGDTGNEIQSMQRDGVAFGTATQDMAM